MIQHKGDGSLLIHGYQSAGMRSGSDPVSSGQWVSLGGRRAMQKWSKDGMTGATRCKGAFKTKITIPIVLILISSSAKDLFTWEAPAPPLLNLHVLLFNVASATLNLHTLLPVAYCARSLPHFMF
uniref:Uncharacterized protein n=1 Tax=Romanomermis culicivorax TaxID=13658 RepID=A0A915L649_ROMCU